jgi:hypothetical protein
LQITLDTEKFTYKNTLKALCKSGSTLEKMEDEKIVVFSEERTINAQEESTKLIYFAPFKVSLNKQMKKRGNKK